jgi:hypothetical protein
VKKFSFTVEEFKADSRLLKRKKKGKMKQSTLKKDQNEPETCNPPFIDLDVDLSCLGKNFTVKSSPSLQNEVWIPSEENVIDGSTLQEIVSQNYRHLSNIILTNLLLFTHIASVCFFRFSFLFFIV